MCIRDRYCWYYIRIHLTITIASILQLHDECQYKLILSLRRLHNGTILHEVCGGWNCLPYEVWVQVKVGRSDGLDHRYIYIYIYYHNFEITYLDSAIWQHSLTTWSQTTRKIAANRLIGTTTYKLEARSKVYQTSTWSRKSRCSDLQLYFDHLENDNDEYPDDR